MIMITVFICECVIFIIIGIVLIPLLSRVSEISRQLYLFLLHIDSTELAKIVTAASQFITIYIDKDSREEDVDSLLLSQNLSV